jgi:hypothetical protein
MLIGVHIAGALIALINENTCVPKTAKSIQIGSCTINHVPLNHYAPRVTSLSVEAREITNIALEAAQMFNFEITPKAQPDPQSLEVASTKSLRDAGTKQKRPNVNGPQSNNLPVHNID